jgi:hypothetical protein
MSPRVLESRLAVPPAPGTFSDREIEDLPDPAVRYMKASVAARTPLAQAARLRMRGSIKVGGRWLSFRARQIEAPHHGFLWAARVAGVIAGSDRYSDGRGGVDWRILGLFRVVHAEGPDVSRSAADRAGAEGIWVPTALLPRRLGRLRSVVFDRWGDPDNAGAWAYHPFGFEVSGYATFDGVSVPSAGRAGWFYGTDRWHDGEFFRSEIVQYELVAEPR